MALSKKLSKAVKDAQKQASDAVEIVRGSLDKGLPDVNVDLTPFYAVVGAATMAVDTVRSASEDLEVAARQATVKDLPKDVRKGAKKEAADLQQRIAELQEKTAELQALAVKFADRFVGQAQDLPAQVINQGLVMASNAKDQYEAAAARGEKALTDLRVQEERLSRDLSSRSEAAIERARRVAQTAAEESMKIARTLGGAVGDDAEKVSAQVDKSVAAVEKAAAPVPVRKTAAEEAQERSEAAQKAAATRKANEAEATATRKVAARTAAASRSTEAKKATPAKKTTSTSGTAKKSTAKTSTAKKSSPAKKTTTAKKQSPSS